MNKEWKLLVTACRLAINKEINQDLLQTAIIDIDWEVLQKLAQYHRVRPLLYKGLITSPYLAQIPIDFLDKLKHQSFHITIRNLNHLKEFRRLLTLFRQNNIDIIPYKGLILAQIAYQEIGLREFTDFDFLFKLDDLPKINQLLIESDYEFTDEKPSILKRNHQKYNCEYGYQYIQDKKRIFAIDLHWTIGYKMHQLDLGYNVFQKLTTQKNLFATTIDLLTPEGILLSTCLHHGGKEQFSELRYLCDIAAILKQYQSVIDWSVLLSHTEQLKVKNLLLFGLAITAKVFKINLPKIVQAALNNKKIHPLVNNYIHSLPNISPPKKTLEAFVKTMNFHINIRAYWSTKVKIYYYSFLQIILPNIQDFQGNELSKIGYYILLLTKPIRLYKKYLLTHNMRKNKIHSS